MGVIAYLTDGTWVKVDLGTADVYAFDRLIRAGSIVPCKQRGEGARRVNLAHVVTYRVEDDDA